MTLNPRAALIAAMGGGGVAVKTVDPEYRPALQAVLGRNGRSPEQALEGYRASSDRAAEIVALLGTIDPDAADWPTTPSLPDKHGFAWQTASEIAMYESEIPNWIVRHYIARRSITELEEKIKTGKTTLIAFIAGAVLTDADFLGQPTTYGPVVWLTEERTPTFRSALARAGLLNRDDLHVLTYGNARGAAWDDIIDATIAKATEVDAALVIFDTIPDLG